MDLGIQYNREEAFTSCPFSSKIRNGYHIHSVKIIDNEVDKMHR